MARRSKNKGTTHNTYQSNYTDPMRDINIIASPLLRVSLPAPLTLLEDRRTYHPDGLFRSPAAVPRYSSRLVISPAKKWSKSNARNTVRSRVRLFESPPATVGFQRPSRVALCVRRKTRREVLFARGSGGKGNRKGKRTYTSQFHCK